MQFSDVAQSPNGMNPISATTPSVPMHSRASRLFKLSYWIYVGAAVLSLVVMAPVVWMPTLLLKLSLIAVGATLVAALVFLGKLTEKGEVSMKHGYAGVAAAAVLPIVYGISYYFSTDKSVAFFGSGTETGTIAIVLLGFVLLVLGFVLTRSTRAGRNLLVAIAGAAFFVALFQYVDILLGTHVLSQTFFGDKTVNLLGKWNDLGLFMALASVLVLARAEFRANTVKQKIATSVILALLFVLLAVVGFSIAWWFVLAASVLFLAVKWMQGGSFAAVTHGVLPGTRSWCSLIVGAVALIMVAFGGTIGSYLPAFISVPSLEVRPGFSATYEIAQASHSGSALRTLIGTGPNTFGNMWLQHKPAGVNETQFWSIDFITGYSVLTTAFASVGLIGLLAWLIPLVLALMALWRIVAMWKTLGEEERSVLFALAVTSAFLWFATAFYAVSQNLLLLAFISTGALMGLMTTTRRSAAAPASPSRIVKWLVILAALLLLIAAVIVAASSVRRLVSASYQQQAVQALSAGDVLTAAQKDSKSESVERYGDNLRLGVQISLAQMQQIASATTTEAEQEAARTAFQNSLQSAIGQGQAAAALNPQDYQPYAELANVYDFLAQLEVQGAYDSERSAYQEAIKRNPTNPALPLLLARTMAAQDIKANLAEVEKLISRSLELKNNYTNAFLLAEQVAASQNDLATATAAAKAAVQSDLGDTPENLAPLYFQLGLFYYTGNDIANAVTALEEATKLLPNYANAQYFLGLAYYKEGRKADAQALFQTLATNNPDNADVQTILGNMKANKADPLAGIKPPANNPAKSPTAPIKE